MGHVLLKLFSFGLSPHLLFSTRYYLFVLMNTLIFIIYLYQTSNFIFLALKF